jgi:protein involved in polysaccharide export with SLBB domain
MISRHVFPGMFLLLLLSCAHDLCGQDNAANLAPGKSPTYLLAPNDVVQIKVYQEDDLETKARVAQDGTISFPLIGVVRIGGKTVEEAGNLIREKLDKDYLVNPQVTLIVAEYSKRRFTVLGQVQKPGSFEIPSEESMTLLEAIAMAGGYTRLADRARVKIARMTEGKETTMVIDTKRAANDSQAMSFQILPDDTITVVERFF